MKPAALLVLSIALPCAFAQAPAAAPPATVGAAIDREISLVERSVIGAVEAMPADKFNFSRIASISKARLSRMFTLSPASRNIWQPRTISCGAEPAAIKFPPASPA